MSCGEGEGRPGRAPRTHQEANSPPYLRPIWSSTGRVGPVPSRLQASRGPGVVVFLRPVPACLRELAKQQVPQVQTHSSQLTGRPPPPRRCSFPNHPKLIREGCVRRSAPVPARTESSKLFGQCRLPSAINVLDTRRPPVLSPRLHPPFSPLSPSLSPAQPTASTSRALLRALPDHAHAARRAPADRPREPLGRTGCLRFRPARSRQSDTRCTSLARTVSPPRGRSTTSPDESPPLIHFLYLYVLSSREEGTFRMILAVGSGTLLIQTVIRHIGSPPFLGDGAADKKKKDTANRDHLGSNRRIAPGSELTQFGLYTRAHTQGCTGPSDETAASHMPASGTAASPRLGTSRTQLGHGISRSEDDR
ncbi:hypothetical protein B0T11DRAFT_59746 [Plectosphaerella cucumerina]|uniref:Uncharacterized protein n=1 Tax=Plectosphaerella cucumerina TaxID=40658 RepID=A0A8K0TNZ4_9PEZI|nr:hypothetical protein B0T11DRAFT_59746 [Plectosphaerella cucumerina]